MTDFVHALAVRVYYEDTDFSGVVYHANYLRFLERGRTEFLRDLGITQATLRDGQTGLPLAFVVRHMELDFLKPARMDDQLIVETAIGHVGGASLAMDQTIRRDSDRLLTARVKVALISDGRARRLPHAFTNRIIR